MQFGMGMVELPWRESATLTQEAKPFGKEDRQPQRHITGALNSGELQPKVTLDSGWWQAGKSYTRGMEVVPAETMERMREVHSLRQIIWGVSSGPICVVAAPVIYLQTAQAVEVAGWYVAPSFSVAQSGAGVRKIQGLKGLLWAGSKMSNRIGGESLSQSKTASQLKAKTGRKKAQ